MVTKPWPAKPLIYEINAWTYLHHQRQQHSDPTLTLATLPDAELDAIANWGFDAVWLMGIWQRSPAACQIAQEHPDLQAEYHRALPDFTPDDVIGSPYAIHAYTVDPYFGGPESLATIRQRFAERGLRLILDFVPNHVAVDHRWLTTSPECFIQCTADEMDAQPDSFFSDPSLGHVHVFANGRDPTFPAWTDTAQLNAFSPVLRAKVVETLRTIADQCDGVRCDMAMLVTNQIFARTWGERAGRVPKTEFWEVVIPAVKVQNPNFIFMAEVYWDMEYELQQQGFDYTYDKRLYDRLTTGNARTIGAHLVADLAYQQHMIRFIENHDEKRAAMALGPGRDLAAAVLIATLPGATLIHDGQMFGPQIKLPVQLGRRPNEPVNREIEAFYQLLLREASHPIYGAGDWQGREALPAWDLNASHRNLIAYTWRGEFEDGDERRLIVVNYSDHSSQGRVMLPDFDLKGRTWHLTDVMHLTHYERDGDNIANNGLYIDLLPWQSHIFSFR
jgi:hypothetical protein